MNPTNLNDEDVPKAPLTINRKGSSSQISQPNESLETRLQNLSLTAPVSTPEVSSLHEHSYCCPFHIVHKPLQSPFQGRQSSFLSLRRNDFDKQNNVLQEGFRNTEWAPQVLCLHSLEQLTK
ncbi:hypothetical protein TNIN_262201 [Trichonephila inaurata madagascariensis]|uniref:Uncharacterized protein n=1 Tax=Trichonephila inaurata madagascariensis TaxID=2747483 RepID=A0A8X6X3R5_9ARAC|nr:hypothetical protein TNIN_262201 [Trichonephila inaurata madagascariensis]